MQQKKLIFLHPKKVTWPIQGRVNLTCSIIIFFHVWHFSNFFIFSFFFNLFSLSSVGAVPNRILRIDRPSGSFFRSSFFQKVKYTFFWGWFKITFNLLEYQRITEKIRKYRKRYEKIIHIICVTPKETLFIFKLWNF